MTRIPECSNKRQSCRGRDALWFSNGSIACTFLCKGGSLADLRLVEGAQVSKNLMWESPWLGPAIPLSDNELASRYGDVNSGRFLHHYTGHALCLDGFGPASEEELAQGGGLHGEAIRCNWRFTQTSAHSLRAQTMLPLAKLAVERAFTLLPEEAVLRVEESIRNVGATPRNIHWVQHATVGSDVFSPGACIATSACEGLTWPLDYEGSNALLRDVRFTWPSAPGESGDAVNLSELFPVPESGFVAAMRQPSDRALGFVAAYQPHSGLVLAYVFPTSIFSWLTFWEENCCRQAPPWNGKVQARGLEFGTTPFPLGNDAVDAQGPLLNSSTSYRLPAGGKVTVPWIVACTRLPEFCGCIKDIQVEEHAIVFCCDGKHVRVPAIGILEFVSCKGGGTG